jgi:hypothetical protein
MSALPPSSAASPTLVTELAHVARLHEERRANPILAGALQRVADWQARRLRATYADLAAQPRYLPAIEFFETDLYGGGDFARRDADLARVMPVMSRMLPAGVIATVGKAVELNALSQELDRLLLARLPRPDGRFAVVDYCRAFRRMGHIADRERQIRLIGEIGAALDHYVEKPLIHGALKMMRQPAKLAGLEALQHFLERGVGAFRTMKGADVFLATIVARETALVEAIFAGETAPFPDPVDTLRPAAAPSAPPPD